jgi:hypothetical protein
MWRRDGSGPFDVADSLISTSAQVAGDGRTLVIVRPGVPPVIDVLSLPERILLKRIEIPGEVFIAMRGDRLITARPRAPKGPGANFVLRSLNADDVQVLGFLSGGGRWREIDATGEGYFISYPSQPQVLASTLKAGVAGQRLALRTSAPVSRFWLAGNGDQIALRTKRVRCASARCPRRTSLGNWPVFHSSHKNLSAP